jgi:predicted glycosyltransferase
VCEILSLKRRAVVVPRVIPTEEQWIRADRMSRLGMFKTIHPGALTPERLLRALTECLDDDEWLPPDINLNALPAVAAHVETLLKERLT